MLGVIKSFEDLVAIVTAAKVPHTVDLAKRAITYPATIPGLEHGMVLRWEPNLQFLHIVQPILMNVPAERNIDVERAVTLANNMSVVPGLGYDSNSRFIYFRITVPVYQDGVPTLYFDHLVKGAIENALEFIGPMRAIVNGAPASDTQELLLAQARVRNQARG